MTEREALEALVAADAAYDEAQLRHATFTQRVAGDRAWWKRHEAMRIAREVLSTPPAPATRDMGLEGVAARVVSEWLYYRNAPVKSLAARVQGAIDALDLALRGEPQPAPKGDDE
jgi:hypothetical protein